MPRGPPRGALMVMTARQYGSPGTPRLGGATRVRNEVRGLTRAWLGCGAPSPSSTEPQLLRFGNCADIALATLRLDDGGVVLLIEGEVVDPLARRLPDPPDIAFDPGVFVKPKPLFDLYLQVVRHRARFSRKMGRRRERSSDLGAWALQPGQDHRAVELKNMLLVNGLLSGPPLALDHLELVALLCKNIAP